MSQPFVLPDAAVRDVRARAALPVVTAAARKDPSMFCRFVLRDERNGARIKQAPMHRRWHDILTEHPRTVIWSHVEGGKTSQVAIGRVLWEIGHEPNLRVAIVSKTTQMAEKIVRSLQQYIDPDATPYAELRQVFPLLEPAKNPALPWNSRALTIERAVVSKDPTIQATGIFGNILGSRVDLLVLDDVLDFQNTNTPAPRQYVYDWIKATAFGRLTEDARVWVVGNAWHPDDAMHRIASEPRFAAYRFPVVEMKPIEIEPEKHRCSDCGGKLVTDPQGVIICANLTWPERWSHKRIEERRQDLSSPLEFARQMLCQARDDDTARFRREWIDICLRKGLGKRLVHSAMDLASVLGFEEQALAAEAERRLAGSNVLDPLAARGIRIFTGVDLAVQRHAAADLTCFFTLALFPNGTRRVLNIESGRWGAPEIRDRAVDHYARYGCQLIVENVGAQHYMVDLIRERSSAPVTPFTTGRHNKAHPEYGVESLAGEFAGGKWEIPCSVAEEGAKDNAKFACSKEVEAWIGELLFYDPKGHTGDRVMGSWFAREGARAAERNASAGGGVSISVITGDDDAVIPDPTE